MGFLWMGSKNIKSFNDFKAKDLKKEQVSLNVRWDVGQADRANAAQLLENYKELGVKATSKDQIDRAAYEMGRQTKAVRRADEGIQHTQLKLSTVDAILDVLEMERKDKASPVFKKIHQLSSDKLEDMFTEMAEARKQRVLDLQTVTKIVTAHAQSPVIEAQRDADATAAYKEIMAARGES
ncbi:MAG TPA: hypothetical protein EYN66_00170 [Myxococcales bacterium]|nr:hypothetical protein [Myxococcales bacterium]